MTKEELQEVMQYQDEVQRDAIKQYFTQPENLDFNKKTIVFSTPSETGTSFFRVFEPLRSLWKAFPAEVNYIYT